MVAINDQLGEGAKWELVRNSRHKDYKRKRLATTVHRIENVNSKTVYFCFHYYFFPFVQVDHKDDVPH